MLEPIAHTTLISTILAGGDAVPNYPGRYQTDPATGRTVDTGNASAVSVADTILDLVTIELPASPGVITHAIENTGIGSQDAAVSIPASTAPPGGGMDADTAAETGQCAQALGQAISGDEDLAAAALDCLPVIPNLGPADNAAPPASAGTEASVVDGAADDGIELNLRYKEGWTPEQRAAADAKVAQLDEAARAGLARVTEVERSGTSAASRYRRAGNAIPPDSDIDHMLDLQLGGADELSNMSPLNSSVNRSLGPQVACQLKDVPIGTPVNRVTIC